jgi:4-amino-4-deoxy-L-arabinose transferase-like glycosyltransferase
MWRKVTQLPDNAWLGLAFILRAGFALKLGNGLYQADENGTDALAWLWSQTGSFEAHGSYLLVPPMHTGVLALCYTLFGHHPLAGRLVGAVAGTALVWTVGRFVKELTRSETSGKIALILATIYPFFIYYSAMLMTETLYTLAATAGLWWLCVSLMDKAAPLWKTAAAGLALGLMGLCRGEGTAISGIILACAILSAVLRGRSWRAWSCALLLWTLPLLGWAYRNKTVTGHWCLDAHGGMAMVHGTILFDLNEADSASAMDAVHGMKFWRDAQSLSDYERDRAFMAASLKYMRDNPGTILAQWAIKTVNFWRFYPRLDQNYSHVPGNNPGAGFGRRMMVLVSLLFEPALIIGGFWGLWSLRARWRETFPLALFVLGTMAVHVLILAQMRYRFPVMPVLMLGFCALFKASERSQKR